MAAAAFDWRNLIQRTGLVSTVQLTDDVLAALDVWLSTAQNGEIPDDMISVDTAILGADVWDEVPEFAEQVADTVHKTRAAVLMGIMPNLASLQITGAVKNPVTFAAILKCQKLSKVMLTFADPTEINEINGNPDLTAGFKALREIVVQVGPSSVDRKQECLRLVATMFALYDKSKPITKILPSKKALIGSALGGGLASFTALAGYPAYQDSGTNTAFQEQVGLDPKGPAITAFAAGCVLGVMGTLALAMRREPQRTGKFFCMNINGMTALEWFSRDLEDVADAYDVISTDPNLGTPMTKTPPRSPAMPRRPPARTRSPSRGR